MANYYTHFSVAFSLPSKEAPDYALTLHTMILGIRANCDSDAYESKAKEMELPNEFVDEEIIEGFCFCCNRDGSDSPGLWLHDDFGAGLDSALIFTQHLLAQFVPEAQQNGWRVDFEWSNDCDKPRLDAFGGGAAIVTAKAIKSMTTGEWLDKTDPD